MQVVGKVKDVWIGSLAVLMPRLGGVADLNLPLVIIFRSLLSSAPTLAAANVSD